MTFHLKKLEDGMKLFEPGVGRDCPLYGIPNEENEIEEDNLEEDKKSSSSNEKSKNSSISTASDLNFED